MRGCGAQGIGRRRWVVVRERTWKGGVGCSHGSRLGPDLAAKGPPRYDHGRFWSEASRNFGKVVTDCRDSIDKLTATQFLASHLLMS